MLSGDKQVKTEALRLELRKALENPVLNSSKILDLSAQLANLDDTNVRFSVDAGVIDRLGRELVGKRETALSELVKNGYDADATHIRLVFQDAWKPGGSLLIVDNGNGMSRDQLINGFMRISSTEKIHQPKSPLYNRTRAGRKGIGRFATQRLGHRLIITTEARKASTSLQLTIEWDNFKGDTDLSSIVSKTEILPASGKHGTRLLIENLRDAWSDADVRKVYRHITELLQPSSLSKHVLTSDTDQGFTATFYREDGGQLKVVANEQTEFLQHAVAVIDAYVDESGYGFWSVKSDKLALPEEVNLIGKSPLLEDKPYNSLKNVHLKTSYFIFEKNIIPSQLLTGIRENLREWGGIRIYRNGFRVLPYGENENDWTGLDASVRKNAFIFPHGNNSFLGFVEVVDPEGKIFEETASREGLLENEAFRELSDFTYRVLVGSALKIADARGRKGRASQRGWTKSQKPAEVITESAEKAKELIDELQRESSNENNTIPKTDNVLNPTQKLTELKDFIAVIQDASEEQERDGMILLEENNQLRVLSGLGLVIGQFIHEIKTFVTAFRLHIEELEDIIGSNSKAKPILDKLANNLKSFITYRGYFDRIISENSSRELHPIELRDVVDPFVETIKPDNQRVGIIINPPIYEGYNLFTTPMHESEWASILFNFYSNSKKAIRRAGAQGRIQIKCGKKGNYLYLLFSDNGDGIPPENKERIFDTFFTTSHPPSRYSLHEEEYAGMGLGLKITKDIIESYKGKIFVTETEPNFKTTICIEIPRNKN